MTNVFFIKTQINNVGFIEIFGNKFIDSIAERVGNNEQIVFFGLVVIENYFSIIVSVKIGIIVSLFIVAVIVVEIFFTVAVFSNRAIKGGVVFWEVKLVDRELFLVIIVCSYSCVGTEEVLMVSEGCGWLNRIFNAKHISDV